MTFEQIEAAGVDAFLREVTCEEERHLFKTREKAIGEIALRALKDRLLLSVYAERKHLHTVCKIVIRD